MPDGNGPSEGGAGASAADGAGGGAGAGGAKATAAYTGKNHKWAVSPATRVNQGLRALFPTLVFVGGAIAFNHSTAGQRFYTWLNTHYTPWEINVYWTLGLTGGLYWLGGLVFMALDMVPALHARVAPYKLQPGVRLTWREYARVCVIVARNQLFVNTPLTLLMARVYPLRTDAPLPGAWTMFWQYWLCMLCEEVGFYFVHRTFHSRRLYARYHKLHHTFAAPVALASTYCSMPEHLFSNLLPIIIPFYVVDAHWSVSIMFFSSLLFGTLSTHSGYNLPGSFNALQHDWHHYAYTENYGPTGLLDGLLGTDHTFRAWLAELERRDGAGWLARARVELAERTG